MLKHNSQKYVTIINYLSILIKYEAPNSAKQGFGESVCVLAGQM